MAAPSISRIKNQGAISHESLRYLNRSRGRRGHAPSPPFGISHIDTDRGALPYMYSYLIKLCRYYSHRIAYIIFAPGAVQYIGLRFFVRLGGGGI